MTFKIPRMLLTRKRQRRKEGLVEGVTVRAVKEYVAVTWNGHFKRMSSLIATRKPLQEGRLHFRELVCSWKPWLGIAPTQGS